MEIVPQFKLAEQIKIKVGEVGKAALATAAALTMSFTCQMQPAMAITADTINQLTYSQVKGTGLANRCVEAVGTDNLKVTDGQKLKDLCIEPTFFSVGEKTT